MVGVAVVRDRWPRTGLQGRTGTARSPLPRPSSPSSLVVRRDGFSHDEEIPPDSYHLILFIYTKGILTSEKIRPKVDPESPGRQKIQKEPGVLHAECQPLAWRRLSPPSCISFCLLYIMRW